MSPSLTVWKRERELPTSAGHNAAFHAPGKRPDEEGAPKGDDEGEEAAAGKTTSEAAATGSAVVSWDTALVRKDPKDGVSGRFTGGPGARRGSPGR